jgi:hypothetical protein
MDLDVTTGLDGRRKQVLVVDDETTVREVVVPPRLPMAGSPSISSPPHRPTSWCST